LTPEEYIEAGEVSRQAGILMNDLADEGIAPADVSIADGGEIHVTVDNQAEAAAVEALGAKSVERPAEAVTGETLAGDAVSDVPAPVRTLSQTVPAGSKFLTSTYHACTLGFWGYDAQNRPVAVTAGHCAKDATGEVSRMDQTDPWTDGGSITDETFGSFYGGKYGSGYDASLVLADASADPQGYVEAVDNGTRLQVPVLGWTEPVVGATICKAGARTGWTCGVITELPKDFVVTDEGSPTVSGFSSSMCSASGDSGSPILAGNYAVGVLSFGSFIIKAGDSAAACNMAEQVRRFKAESLPKYAEAQQAAVLALLDTDPSRLILTGGQAMTGPGKTVESLFGQDFRLALAVPTPTIVKKSATKSTTVVKGKIDLMGRANTDYKVKVKVGPRNYTVVPNAAGAFVVKGAPLKSAKKVTITAQTYLQTEQIHQSGTTEKKIKSSYQAKKAKKAAKAKAVKAKKLAKAKAAKAKAAKAKAAKH
jgi:hypothetical protein